LTANVQTLALGADKTRQNWGAACWCAVGILAQALAHCYSKQKGKSAGWLTIVSSPADLSCPSWA
jgi:hypothetical protein